MLSEDCIMTPQEIVIKIRQATGLNQTDFALLAGLYRTSISQFETGERFPLPHHAKKYLRISKKKKLGFRLEDFYEG